MAWTPSRGKPTEQRIRDLEQQVAELSNLLGQVTSGALGTGFGGGAGSGGGGGNTIRLPLPEAKVKFDAVDGHTHDGTEGDGKQIPHANLTIPGSALLDAARHSDTAAATPVRGDLIRGNSSAAWDRLAVGTINRVLKSDGTDPSWSFVAHSELSGTGSNLLNGSSHSDTANVSPSNGDLIARISGVWNRLAVGTNDYFLRVVAGQPAWVQLAFSMVTGSISAAQHGNLASTAGSTADHTGTISANARIQAAKNGSNVGSPRPTVDFIEGSNVTITITDTGSKYEVTIAQTSVSAATVIVKEGGSAVTGSADTLDFAAADFNVTESPSGEANIAWQGFTVEEGNSAVATDVKNLDFGAGFDVSAAGGEAEIGLDLSEVATGDVVYTGNAGRAQALLGVGLEDTLGVSRDLHALTYAHNGGISSELIWSRRDFPISEFSRANISLAGTVYAAMPRPGANGTNVQAPWVALVPTYITGLVASYDGNVDATTDSHSVILYVNGVAQTASELTTTGANDKSTLDLLAAGTQIALSAGDELEVWDKRTGAISSVGVHVTVFGCAA